MRFLRKKRPKTIDFTRLPDARVKRNPNLKVAGDCIDLREENLPQTATSSVSTTTSAAGSVMDFLVRPQAATSSSAVSDYSSSSNEVVELKRMLRASSGRIEDNSNEIYRLLQKIELLERKIERLEERGGL